MNHKNFYPVILAGGFGTRTREVLHGKPKALIVSSDGETLLKHLLVDLESNDFESTTIVSNALFFDQINDHVSELAQNGLLLSVKLLNDGAGTSEKRLGALGDLLLAFGNINFQDSLLVFASDYAYWKSFNVADVVRFAAKEEYKDCFITLTRQVEDKNEIAGRYGCPEVDEHGFVKSYEEKPKEPKSNLATIAFYVYRPKHLALLSEFKESGGNMDSPSNFIPFLLQKGEKVVAMVVKNDAIDAGTPEEIAKARNY